MATTRKGEDVMIIDKKGRLFGKISIIDILIILVLIAIIIFAYKFFNKKEVVVNDDTVDMYYTVETRNMTKEFIDQVRNNEGKSLYNAVRNYYIGEMVSCEVEPFYTYENNYETGTVDRVECEGKYSVYIKIKGSAKLSEKDITVGEQEIKVGMQLAVKGKGFATNTWIVKVELQEDAK